MTMHAKDGNEWYEGGEGNEDEGYMGEGVRFLAKRGLLWVKQ